jgi:hypothetical protein
MSVEKFPDAIDGRWLLDGVLSYTSPMKKPKTSDWKTFRHYAKKIPTWAISVVLFAGGVYLKFTQMDMQSR